MEEVKKIETNEIGKNAIIALLISFGIVFILAIFVYTFLPTNDSQLITLEIDAPVEQVKEQLQFQNWENWACWFSEDPNIEFDIPKERILEVTSNLMYDFSLYEMETTSEKTVYNLTVEGVIMSVLEIKMMPNEQSGTDVYVNNNIQLSKNPFKKFKGYNIMIDLKNDINKSVFGLKRYAEESY